MASGSTARTASPFAAAPTACRWPDAPGHSRPATKAQMALSPAIDGASAHTLEPEQGTSAARSPEARRRDRQRDRAHRAKLIAAIDLPAPTRTRNALLAAVLCRRDWMVIRQPSGAFSLVPLVCDRKHCRQCARDWSHRLTTDLLRELKKVDPRNLRHLVLTVRNAPRGHLDEWMSMLRRIFREWRNQGRRAGWWKPDGWSAKVELDLARNPDRAWHPHIHVLLHQRGGLNIRRGAPARAVWERLTEAAPCGKSPAMWCAPVGSDGVAREVGKYAAKPLALSADPSALVEAVSATLGFRWLSSGGDLSVRVGRQTGGSGATWCGTLRQALKGNSEHLSAHDGWTLAADLEPGDLEMLGRSLEQEMRIV